jgi:hypothetical protein
MYRRGDRVRVKSRAWYEANKSSYNSIQETGYGRCFIAIMAGYCGTYRTITDITNDRYGNVVYRLDLEDTRDIGWHDWMFDAAGTKNIKEVW